MNNRIGLGLNITKKLLLASAGAAALVGPIAMGVIIAAGHMPILLAQPPLAVPAVAQTVRVPQTTAANVAAQMAQSQGATVAAPDRRLLTLLLDCGSLTADEQARARQAAIQNLHGVERRDVGDGGDGWKAHRSSGFHGG